MILKASVSLSRKSECLISGQVTVFAASLSSVAVVNQHFRWLNGSWLTWDLCWTIGDAKSCISWGENIQLVRSSDSVPGGANHVFLTILQDWNKPSRQCLALGNDVQSSLHFLAAHELEVCLVFVMLCYPHY